MKPETTFVYEELAKMGVDVRGYHVRIHDVDQKTIMQRGGKHTTRTTTGLAVHCGHLHDIYLRCTLDETQRKGVLAHELGHVWLYERQSPFRNSRIENEGFCELLAYRLYGVIGTFRAQGIRLSMLHGTNPIYSEGFRMMKRRAEKMGWENFLKVAAGICPPEQLRPRFVIREITPPRMRIVDRPAPRIHIRAPFTIVSDSPAKFTIKSNREPLKLLFSPPPPS
jgi:hypothetical protein